MSDLPVSNQGSLIELPKDGDLLTVQQSIKLNNDFLITVSRDKLKHLKDLADDERFTKSEWN